MTRQCDKFLRKTSPGKNCFLTFLAAMIRSNLNPTLGNGEFNNLLVKLYKLEQKKMKHLTKLHSPSQKKFLSFTLHIIMEILINNRISHFCTQSLFTSLSLLDFLTLSLIFLPVMALLSASSFRFRSFMNWKKNFIKWFMQLSST